MKLLDQFLERAVGAIQVTRRALDATDIPGIER